MLLFVVVVVLYSKYSTLVRATQGFVQTMLALLSAFGVVALNNNNNKVHVFSQLGGKLLGIQDARYTTPETERFDAFEERIKRFIAKKMPHEHGFFVEMHQS